ncbi:MAG: DinB family protein [Acidobacteriota bacterium]
MNDYAQRVLALLGDHKPLEVLAATPSRLEDLFWELKEKGLGRSLGEGKWTASQIFAHLTDAEIGYAFRVRQVLTEAGHRVQTFDQDSWLALYRTVDVSLVLELFRALRLWNLELFRSLTPEQWSHLAVHPERGEETLETMSKLLAAHDLNHLAQLEQIAAIKA